VLKKPSLSGEEFKMRIKTTEFEGTPEEFAKVAPMLSGQNNSSEAKAAPTAESSENGSGVSVEITPKLVLAVLNRRYLSSAMRGVLKTMLKSGPKGLTTTDIAKAIGHTRQELAGVFGAFGRRVANTKGWPGDVSFVEYARDEGDEGEWRYWLPQVVRDVLESGQFKL
jgi:hypothetical protein